MRVPTLHHRTPCVLFNTTTAFALAPATLTHLDAGRAACGFECGEGSEEDALPRTEGHRAVVCNGDAVKFHEHVSLAQHLQQQRQQQWVVQATTSAIRVQPTPAARV